MKFEELDIAKSGDGLIPAIVQDDTTMQVLMLGYMNREAYEMTLALKKVTFWSRTRQELWTKGATSGNWFDLVSIAPDCDRDALLVRVIPAGPACHTGQKNCFATRENEGFIRYLSSVVRQRHADMPAGSYTTKLFEKGIARIAQKVGEEAVETIIAAMADDRGSFIYEASDLVYHLLVLLEQMDCTVEDIEKELAARHK